MYNSPYNRTPYNRLASNFVEVDVKALGKGSFAASALVDLTASLHAEGVSGLSAALLVERLLAIQLHGIGTIKANADREKLLAVSMRGTCTLAAHAKRYHVDEIVLAGAFKPGDRLVIDARNLTIKLNGQNALHMLKDGDFFDLNVGENVIWYSDPHTNRRVLIRFTHQDKFV